ncbi:MAG: exopolyphosphatase [Planctomycetes bacterium]|nr:exopolyphosphatase [Planctomycetota bacterium]
MTEQANMPSPAVAAAPAQAGLERVAAVDLGSNSFHLVLAHMIDGEVRIIDRLRERVHIADGLDGQKNLGEDAQQRALECLERFAEHVRQMPIGHVRAVGTSTFRRARNRRGFLKRAESVLGHPIEIISGQEEARLTYLGVAQSCSPEPGRRLVVDIGGGSTECILGEGLSVIQSESFDMGCVGFSAQFFPRGEISRDAFRRAVIAGRLEIEEIENLFRPQPWSQCLGSSGTILAIHRIARASGWCDSALTLEALRKLRRALMDAGNSDAVSLPELKDDRRPVLAGGLAILLAVFEGFEIDRMISASGALREGLLFDLTERFQKGDHREIAIGNFLRRFQIDAAHGERVEKTARELLSQVAAAWELADPYLKMLLGWAARLHEVGLAVSHISYHKHGEYLLAHAELAGFSDDDQRVVAALVRCHRKRLDKELLADLPHVSMRQALRLVVLLRIAVVLERTRGARDLPPLRATADGNSISLLFPSGWLEEHALTQADLQKEAAHLESVGYELEIR